MKRHGIDKHFYKQLQEAGGVPNRKPFNCSQVGIFAYTVVLSLFLTLHVKIIVRCKQLSRGSDADTHQSAFKFPIGFGTGTENWRIMRINRLLIKK